MDAMQSFLTEEKQKEKKRRINRRSYLNRLELEGKLTKEKKIIKRRQKVCELMQKGKSKEEICKNLEISRATYYADKKAIETVKNAIGRVHKQPEGEDKEYAFKERLSEACGALKDTYADVTDTRYFNTGPPA
jgi:ACT domain-containing protein